jgi:hypothetical protein
MRFFVRTFCCQVGLFRSGDVRLLKQPATFRNGLLGMYFFARDFAAGFARTRERFSRQNFDVGHRLGVR